MDPRAPRLFAIGIGLLLAAQGALASGGYDAGTGTDAGSSREGALALSYGSYTALAQPKDEDWFRFPGVSNGHCLKAVFDAPLKGVVTLLSEGENGERKVKQSIQSNDGRLGLSVLPSTATYAALKRTGSGEHDVPYGFTVTRLGLAEFSTDGFTLEDAGSTLSTALRAGDVCIPGSLRSTFIGDAADVYSVAGNANDTIAYSLVATGDATRAVLLSSTGEAIGPVIQPGQSAAVTVPSTDTFYVETSTSSSSSSSYLMGLTVGPDPGSGCRPMCLYE